MVQIDLEHGKLKSMLTNDKNCIFNSFDENQWSKIAPCYIILMNMKWNWCLENYKVSIVKGSIFKYQDSTFQDNNEEMG